MEKKFKDGVYPVMLTPFTEDDQVDYEALGKLVDWYIDAGAAGLFAVCQSSEMFCLSREERVSIARFVAESADKRAAVIASGHISDSLDDQAEELNAIAETGADAVILLTNRLAEESQSDEIWLENLKYLLERLPKDIPLGFYECPYPYKRILSPKLLKWCADTGRFYFLKDTSCDITDIKEKLKVIHGTQLKLFNANSATLLESLELGASGYSGVMANFHPEIYSWLTDHFRDQPQRARLWNDFLTVASFIECRAYPVNAKYYQMEIGNFNSLQTRTKSKDLLDDTGRKEVEQLDRLTTWFKKTLAMQSCQKETSTSAPGKA
ncbi:MAG: dihydrodipicolinate synthase family protein [Clostridiales bacterium]|nr:dihydrodipicolinate synthase family protein [Clostridiales bacterium]MDU3242253.1 dihydrodipicolinate synthase family protein [Clostridiales bacterium]